MGFEAGDRKIQASEKHPAFSATLLSQVSARFWGKRLMGNMEQARNDENDFLPTLQSSPRTALCWREGKVLDSSEALRGCPPLGGVCRGPAGAEARGGAPPPYSLSISLQPRSLEHPFQLLHPLLNLHLQLALFRRNWFWLKV